jgi:hypothetical protein
VPMGKAQILQEVHVSWFNSRLAICIPDSEDLNPDMLIQRQETCGSAEFVRFYRLSGKFLSFSGFAIH